MKPAAEPTPHWSSRLTRGALPLGIALAIARATVVQIVREPQLTMPGADTVPRSAGPTTALLLDLLLCVPALLALARSAFDRDFRLRWSGSAALFGGFSIFAAISTAWSPDKFLTLVTAADMIGAAALMWAMIQLVRGWAELRLVAGGCCAILLIYIVNGILYETVDLPDSISFFEQNKEKIFADRNWEPNSYAAQRFEQKVRSTDLSGFNTSPNTLAAMIVMLGAVVLGATIQRLTDHDEPGWAAALIVLLLGAAGTLYFTFSKTALLTPLIAMAMLALAPWVARHRKRAYRLSMALTALGALAVVGYGLIFHRLPTRSMAFRWQYWLGAAKIIARHPLLGVSWSNFGLHYLAVRLPNAPEEIRDPHNLIIRALAELGLIGGALMLAWLARLGWELISPAAPLPVQSEANQSTSRATAITITTVCGLAMLLNILASVDFASDYAGRGWVIVLELMRRGLFAGAMLLAFALICIRSSIQSWMDDRPSPWLARAMIAGLAVFVIHNLVDFSLFEPGPMTAFAMLAGAAIGIRSGAGRSRGTGAVALVTIAWIAAACGIVVPIIAAERKAQLGDALLRDNQAPSAAAALQDAFNSLWITNLDYAYRAACAMEYAHLPPEKIRAMFDAAIRANPFSELYRRAAAQMELHEAAPDAGRIIDDFEHALTLDPNDADAHIDFADALVQLGQKQRAIDEYRAALQCDDKLERDEPKRMSQAKVAEIRGKIAQLSR